MTRDRTRPPDLAQVMTEMLRLSALLDDALSTADDAAHAYADADSTYRRTHAKAFTLAKARGSTDAASKARADEIASNERNAYIYTRQAAQVSLETIRARRAQISALQTAGNAIRAEISMARTGPQPGP